MGTPKRRFSKSRRDKRAAQWKITPPTVEECPRCHQTKAPHHVCPNCGYYKDRSVIQFEQ